LRCTNLTKQAPKHKLSFSRDRSSGDPPIPPPPHAAAGRLLAALDDDDSMAPPDEVALSIEETNK